MIWQGQATMLPLPHQRSERCEPCLRYTATLLTGVPPIKSTLLGKALNYSRPLPLHSTLGKLMLTHSISCSFVHSLIHSVSQSTNICQAAMLEALWNLLEDHHNESHKNCLKEAVRWEIERKGGLTFPSRPLSLSCVRLWCL